MQEGNRECGKPHLMGDIWPPNYLASDQCNPSRCDVGSDEPLKEHQLQGGGEVSVLIIELLEGFPCHYI